ncbi:MAG: glycosyltransferase [Balneolaceae bacterium]|nr:glycosyltransferase [Balneolaceae bacterium]
MPTSVSKKILIVSRSFYPMNSPRSFRTTELVKEFARQGHEVTLLTPKDDELHTNFEKEHGVVIKDLGTPAFGPIELKEKSGISWLISKLARRALYQLFEYPDIQYRGLVKRALRKESGYDLLISIAVPHPIHWGVAAVWNRNIAKIWVADCGDPYMGSKLDTINKFFYFSFFEKAFCRKADYITVPIEEAKEGYYSQFREKIRVIPQGFRFEDAQVNGSYSGGNGRPRFAYAGGLIPGGRDPRPLLDHLITQERDFHFILYTRNHNLVEPYVGKGRGEIEIRDYIPRSELLNVMAGMDFLVNIENETAVQMPSKLIDYYLTGRPVLSVSGSSFAPDSVDRFLMRDYSDKVSFEDMDRYRIENVCRQFLTLGVDG